ncbi:MAG: hypothetical protein R3E93_11540 [Thiothrix sp.]
MDTRRLATPWAGWGWYDDLYLVDPNGTRYSQDMIRTSAWTMELAHELTGSPLQVMVMKAELKKRLATPPPEILIRWNGQETRILPPSWKLKI